MLLCLVPTLKTGELKSGTIVLTFFSKDKAIFAAESRLRLKRTDNTVGYSEDGCKVRAIEKRFIFATSGINAFEHIPDSENSWDGYQAPSTLANKVPADASDPVKVLVTLWGEWMERHLNDELARNPEPILRGKRNDVLTYAMFAGLARQAGLTIYRAQLRCACSGTVKRAVLSIDPVALETSTMGRFGSEEGADIADELLYRKSERAREEIARWKIQLNGVDKAEQEGAVTVWAAEFVVKYVRSEEIGGPVDAVEMTSDGRIRWIRRKPNCPDH